MFNYYTVHLQIVYRKVSQNMKRFRTITILMTDDCPLDSGYYIMPRFAYAGTISYLLQQWDSVAPPNDKTDIRPINGSADCRIDAAAHL